MEKYKIKNIKDILPHDKTMLLIDGVLSFDLNAGVKTFYKIQKNSIFFDKSINGVHSFVFFECIAQSLGIYNGIKEKINSTPRDENLTGVLINVSNMECYKTHVETENNIVIDVFDINIVGASVMNAKGAVYIHKEKIEDKIMEASLTVSIINSKNIA